MNSLFSKKAKKLVAQGDSYIKRNGVKNFHLQAKELLTNSQMHDDFDIKQLAAASFDKSFKLKQNFEHLEFSDLPITIARGEQCFIDIYFWRRRPTVIHDHHFYGAFQCLVGQNVDSEFKFRPINKLTKFHTQGELELIKTKTLKKGDIESINFLNKFIHQNHHQADLTVNLCFRTNDQGKKNLSNYFYSGLKFEKDPASLSRIYRLLAFAQIEKIDPRKLNLNLIDAFNFLIMTYYSNSTHPNFIKLKKYFNAKVTKETGLKIDFLLNAHEKILNKIEEEYE
ncbi:MAG: hypothetical protein AB7I27_14215 [Bacteriovoracaceae bacterium]